MTDNIILQVVAAMISLGVIFTVHAIYRPKSLKISIFMIFLSITTPLALYKPFVDSLGFPVFSSTDSKQEFITYLTSADQEWIYLWIMDTDSSEPRAYKIPYTKEAEKELAEAKEKVEEGVQQGIEIPPPPPGVSDTNIEIEISELYDISPGGLKFNETAN